MVVLTIAGIVSMFQLPVAIFPALTVPRIIITTDAGDLPSNLVLSQITRPMEAAVAGVPGVERIYTTTQRGNDELDVSFVWGTNMQIGLQKVQSAITDLQSELPSGATPTAEVLNPSVFPVLGYSLYSDTVSPERLRQIALLTLRPRLMRVKGVREVMVQGGDTPDYLIEVRPDALIQRGVDVQQIEDALANTNAIQSVGSFSHSYLQYQVMVSGLLHGADDIRNVTISVKNGVPITIGDIASVTRGTERRTVETSGDGHDAVLINIVKQPEGNTIDLADGVRSTLQEVKRDLPPGITFSLFYDQSEIVHESQNSVVEAISVGAVLVLIVLLLFLQNLRAAFIVLLLLPVTLLITFAAMRLLGMTLNIMTLGAVAIALGLVIDDGIVVVESIFSEIEHGHSPRESVAIGLHKTGPAMIGSSLTTIAAFLPLTFLSGVTGQFFGPLALVMTSMLLISLCLSMLLVPLVAERVLRTRNDRKVEAAQNKASWAGRLFVWTLNRRAWILVALIPVAAVGAFLFTRLQTGFFPEFDEGGFILDYQAPSGTSLAETDSECRKVEAILAQDKEIAAWSRRTGLQLGFDITPVNQGDFSVKLVGTDRRPINAIMDDLRDKIGDAVPALQVDFSQILQDNIGDIAGSPSPIEVKIFGSDFTKIKPIAEQVEQVASSTPGIVDTFNGIIGTGIEVSINVNTAEAQRYGLTVQDVQNAARAALDGVETTQLQEGEQTVPIRILISHPQQFDPSQLGNVTIISPVLNAPVPLSEIATIQTNLGATQITREDQRPEISVTGGLSGRDLGSAVHDLQSRISKQIKLPPGFEIEYGGLYSSQQRSFGELAVVLATAILLVTTLLVIQLRSFRQAFALLIAAVLSLIGVAGGLAVTQTPLNISSFTGMVMIVGIVTENGIVLFDSFNRLAKEDGRMQPDHLLELLARAGQERFRPILMTTVGAILALLPLAFGLGAGAAMQRPLAIAVIGGLLVSPLFTLIVAPAIFLSLAKTPNFSWKHS